MPDSLCMKIDTAMSLIRAADAVGTDSRAGVYKAAKSILLEVIDSVDMMISAADPAATAEDDE